MATKATITLNEFLKLPETKPESEYICGEVIQKPMPTRKHAFIQGFIFVALFQFLAQTKLGRAGTEWRCIFGPSGRERALTPDVTYVTREYLTEDEYPRRAPDLVVEVLSPDQPAGRFAEKVEFYLQNGVRLVWVFDPEAREVSVFAPGVEPFTLSAGQALDGGEVLPGFTLSVDDVFAQLTN